MPRGINPGNAGGDSQINNPPASSTGNPNLAANVYQFDGGNRAASDSNAPNQYQFSGGGSSGEFYNYQVQRGDTLYSIAENQVSRNGMSCPTPAAIANEEQLIIQANEAQYPSLKCNPNLVCKGWELKIPTSGNSDNNAQNHHDFGFSECANQPPDAGPRTPTVNETQPPGAVTRHTYCPPNQPPQNYGEGANVPNYSAQRPASYQPPTDPVEAAYQAAQIRTYGEFGNPAMGGGYSQYGYGGMGMGMGMGMGGYNPMMMGGYNPMMMGGYNPAMMGGYNPAMMGGPMMYGGYGGYNPGYNMGYGGFNPMGMGMGGMMGGGYGMGMGNNMQMTETSGIGGTTMGNSPMFAPSPGVAGFAGDTSALTSAFMPLINTGSTLALAFTGRWNPMMSMGGMFGGFM